MTHMLKNHERSRKKTNLFTIIPFFRKVELLEICKLDTITFPKQL